MVANPLINNAIPRRGQAIFGAKSQYGFCALPDGRDSWWAAMIHGQVDAAEVVGVTAAMLGRNIIQRGL